ncbi:MAG: rod shape-determining protein MreC [Chloroflexi bacterium]|uniref:Cell shape-determining protein MreC n=1 Tax=Candidatus Chlorohelix allophototropha TaxID=3003348 RepID=A0A8T7MA65_9CHLR|nr:rod shape-determining protein MreC [Chloroflexota bacterium]WJW68883.1 rod shape-determining protein MreC [Chloroflexota bacterium L227-S17]
MLRKLRADVQVRFIFFGVLLVASSLLMVLDRVGFLRPVEQVITALTSPIEQGAYNLGHNLSDLSTFLKDLNALKEENSQLRQQLQTVQEDRAKAADLASQLLELEKELAFKSNPENKRFQTVSADVINRDLTGNNQAIQINKGSNDNITKGMPVVDVSGFLVGRVEKVETKRSTVLLITDTGMAANVYNKRFGQNGKQLTISKNADGTAVGQWQRGGRITIFRISKDADIKPGDYIFTDGKGATFPADILVGFVTDVITSDSAPDKEAVLAPSSDIERIQRVQVILGTNETN